MNRACIELGELKFRYLFIFIARGVVYFSGWHLVRTLIAPLYKAAENSTESEPKVVREKLTPRTYTSEGTRTLRTQFERVGSRRVIFAETIEGAHNTKTRGLRTSFFRRGSNKNPIYIQAAFSASSGT